MAETISYRHIKLPEGYPQPSPVPENATWVSIDKTTYRPPDYTSQSVFDHDRTIDPLNPRLWADPVDPKKVDHPFISYEGEVRLDARGRPLNPMGPTGIEGRGRLGKWGVNNAVDSIVTRIDKNGKFQIIIITRKDSGAKALPGGMIDKNEKVKDALKRELLEEASANIDFENSDFVYQGYVDDPRNTDNAWMETDAHHIHLDDGDIELSGGDDATEAIWTTVDSSLLNSLYASHGEVVKKAVAQWQSKEKKTVNSEGQVISVE